MLHEGDLHKALENVDALSVEERSRVLELLKERDRLTGIKNAKVNFLDFVKSVWPEFIPGAHHTLMADAFERVVRGELKRLIINMPPRHPVLVDTPVFTTAGWQTVENIKVGDRVFAPSGDPVEVIGKSPVYTDRDLYRVVTDDGAEIVCDGEHEWTVRLDRKTKRYISYKTKDLYKRGLGCNIRRKRGGGMLVQKNKSACKARRPKLMPQSPIKTNDVKLPIDPYVLGVWLGDGTAAQAIVSMTDADASLVRKKIEKRGYKTTDQSTPMTFGVLKLKVILREEGLLGNKHIPEAYLKSSTHQKLELIRGLMDTDGNVTKEGTSVFSQKDRSMVEAFRVLLWSLGIKNNLLVYEVPGYGTHHKVTFYAKDTCTMPRKKNRQIDNTRGRFITIEKTPQTGRTQCLEVASKDHLFLAGKGFVPCNNTKSEFASWLLPAWYLGLKPTKKVIQASNTEALASGFGRRVRNLIDGVDMEPDEEEGQIITYKDIFPKVKLAKDSQAAAGWHTSKGGEYFAIGVSGKVTGKGADIFIVDDPHSEQEAKQAETNPDIFDSVYDWFTSGPRQRLQPGGAIVMVMTRWGKRDLTGRVIKQMEENTDLDGNIVGDTWEVINIPAIIDEGEPTERAMWPGYWSLEELNATKSVLPVQKWQAQYQQKPTSEEGAIIKRESWRKWGAEGETCPGDHHRAAWDNLNPPACSFIITSWDTALKKNQRADYSAMTTWGIFSVEDKTSGKTINNAILLSAYKERLEFPELKKKVKQYYAEDMPDTLLIEDKGSGISLIQELRSTGVPVENFSYGRGSRGVSNDKVARANLIADVFASGYVWAPERRFAEEVATECAEFPNGEHDDYVDSVVQAMLRFRAGGLISTMNDDDSEDGRETRRRIRRYY